MPRLLPHDLLRRLAQRRRIAICLDYDGTIAPITPNPEEALPTAEIRDLISALAHDPERVRVAVASGRTAGEVKALLGIEAPLAFIGLHGLEVVDWDGRRRLTSPVEHCRAALDKARVWLNTVAGSRHGFFVEDKGLAVALHYRRANRFDAQAVVERLRRLVAGEAGELLIVDGDMVVEMLPRVAPDKGFAFLSLIERERGVVPVFFSDDHSDEGAFYKLRREGITVLVGPERMSCAEFRIESADRLAQELSHLACMLQA
jgi:trehalose 6-phosphate phosphatase